ncbi:hypothetical protein Alg130_11834, partial [Pyrenophora tritici-repentis]
VNPDIRTENVVFGEALQYYYPAYKTPKITDYGNAFFDDPAHPAVNLADIVFAPPGWGPPEQIPNPPEAYSKTPIKIHSNIYNVGQIMLSLMEGRADSATINRIGMIDSYLG